MPKTSIEWCDFSWPVLNGCRRKSIGCTSCYAERLAATRLRHTKRYRGLATFGPNGPSWTGESRLDIEELSKPLRMRKPRRIFVCEMGDLFYEVNTNEQIAAVFGVIAACPQHTFQCLTKRPKRMVEWFQWISRRTHRPITECVLCANEDFVESGRHGVPISEEFRDRIVHDRWPLPNLWLGVSVENQAAADERIPRLLQTPAAIRWVSAEPLLGPLDLDQYVRQFCGCGMQTDACDDWKGASKAGCKNAPPRLNWVVVGGESGPGARPMDEDWVRSIRNQCFAAEVPLFYKQRLDGGRKVSLPLLDGVRWDRFPTVTP